jgi:hypothetical protein
MIQFCCENAQTHVALAMVCYTASQDFLDTVQRNGSKTQAFL